MTRHPVACDPRRRRVDAGRAGDVAEPSGTDLFRQLSRLASESGQTAAELAAQITGQLPPEDAADPGLRRLDAAWAAAEAAADADALAAALLDETLAAKGAVGVALWLIEPDGGLELAGQAG